MKTEKRLSDLFLSVFILIITSPLIVIILILVRFETKGWAWIKLPRVGKNSKCFYIYKIRTMYKGEERVTKIGQFLRKIGLDELPQVINIIKGEMSLVGPRPEIPQIVGNYCDYEKKRLLVLPGLTGLWQLSPYRCEPIHHHLEYDFQYIEERTELLDLKIIFLTILWFIKNVSKPVKR